MADVFSSSIAARLLNKPVAHAGSWMDTLLPLVILTLSATLIATSVVRRTLEKKYGRRPKWARQSLYAFAALRNQLQASEVPALKASWQEASYEQEPNVLREQPSQEEKPRRRKLRKNAHASREASARAGIPEAAEPTASELEEQPQSESDVSSESEAVHKVHVESVAASDEEEQAAEMAAVEPEDREAGPPAMDEERGDEPQEGDVEEERLFDFSTPVPSTSEEHMIYSASLLLAHRELCLRIARGAPGLSKPEGCASHTPAEDAVPAKEEAPKEAPKEKSPKKAPQPAVNCTPEELQEMAPPTRKGKLVVTELELAIYINDAQSRYQIYRNGKELRSVSWGGSSASRIQASWKKVQAMASSLSGRKSSNPGPLAMEP